MFYAIGGTASIWTLWLTLFVSIVTSFAFRFVPKRVGLIASNVTCFIVYFIFLLHTDLDAHPWYFNFYYFGSCLIIATCGHIITYTFWPAGRRLSPAGYPAKFVSDLIILFCFTLVYGALACFGQIPLMMLLKPQGLLIPVAMATPIFFYLLYNWLRAKRKLLESGELPAALNPTVNRQPVRIAINTAQDNSEVPLASAPNRTSDGQPIDRDVYRKRPKAKINPTFIAVALFGACFVFTFLLLTISMPPWDSLRCMLLGFVMGLVGAFFLRSFSLPVRVLGVAVFCFMVIILLLTLFQTNWDKDVRLGGVIGSSFSLAMLCEIVCYRLWSSGNRRRRTTTFGTFLVDMIFVMSACLLLYPCLMVLYGLFADIIKHGAAPIIATIYLVGILAVLLSPAYIIHEQIDK